MKKLLAFSIAAMLGLSMSVLAAPLPGSGAIASPPSPPAHLSPWLIRLRGIAVVANPTSGTISVIGGRVSKISNEIVPELDISYFFTDNIAAELILATTKHSVTATGTAAGTVYLGTVRLLPPTLTFQYHACPHSMISPYIGAGINYTYFYNVKPNIATSIRYSDSFGPALQAGVDIHFTKHLMLNLDVKKIMIGTTAIVDIPKLGSVITHVKINPMVYGVGIGYRI